MNSKRLERLRILTQTDGPYWAQSQRLAGMDEVGRGPLAGPVMAACVIMPPEPLLAWVDDSKALSEARREQVFAQIMDIALFVGMGRAEPEEIDAMNILQATKLAMRRAAHGAQAQLYLIDALENLDLDGEERGIIHGDALSYTIAAASIVAKVTRDREMRLLDLTFPQYAFARNKGYGTPEHIAALRAHGPCPIHRRSFIGHFCSLQ
jgi:ribonuclease HII